MKCQNNLKIGKEFVYALFIVIILIFGLFFLSQYFDISTSAFTVKEHNNVKEPSFSDELGEKLEDITNSETFNFFDKRFTS